MRPNLPRRRVSTIPTNRVFRAPSQGEATIFLPHGRMKWHTETRTLIHPKGRLRRTNTEVATIHFRRPYATKPVCGTKANDPRMSPTLLAVTCGTCRKIGAKG